MSQLRGKRFWLIGASAGIGRHLALSLAEEGATLVVSARNEAALAQLLVEMENARGVAPLSGDHEAIPLDVSTRASVSEAFSRVGHIDGMIYCAGAYEPMSARQPDLDSLETIVEVNLIGVLRILAHCVPTLCQQNAGHVVLVGSISGYRGLPNAWGYGATKAAMIHLAENLRCDLLGTDIHVQVCNPGFVSTRLTEKNAFDMPFIMSPEAAARRIVKGMKRKHKFEIAFPWAMVTLLKCLTILPYFFFFRLMKLIRRKFGPSS